MKHPKDKLLYGLLSLALISALLAIPAAAASGGGMSNLQSIAKSAQLIPQTATNGTIPSSDGFYPGAQRFELRFIGDANKQYFVAVVPGDVTSIALDQAVYVNQYQADGSGKVVCAKNDAPFPSSLSAGTYSVFANGMKIASFEYTAVSSTLLGDLNDDGVVNSVDLGILWNAENYNKTVAEAVNKKCDLNGDGTINSVDLGILWNAENYNKSSN